MAQNQQWQLARRPPGGYPQQQDYRFVNAAMAEPAHNQLLSRVLYLSLDPYQWGRRRSGVEAVGEVCHGRTVSQVVKSRHGDYQEGDIIFNTLGWQLSGLTGEGISIFNYMRPRKLDSTLAPVSTALGVLGMLGLTAYAGTLLQCQPTAGETFVVSAAAGGVGQLAGQLAKLRGARVVGIAGAQHKCDFLTGQLGFDAAVSHLADDFEQQLARACPDGVDCYFENVGGKVFAALLPLFNTGARVCRCGLISQYGNTDGLDPQQSWQATGQATFDRNKMAVHSLFVGDFVSKYQDQFLAEMAGWVADGAIQYKEHLWQGLECVPQAFDALLCGDNFGKSLVALGPDPTLTEAIILRRAQGNTVAAS